MRASAVTDFWVPLGGRKLFSDAINVSNADLEYGEDLGDLGPKSHPSG